ncbi:MAG: hypothetical protein K2G40_00775 [Muribaculaceae bacterium]|nr:hypothetical protein [Muribaculaceae bacterium]
MKTFITSIVLFLSAMAGLTACTSDNDYNNEVPQPVQEFLSEYFPGQDVSGYSNNGDTYRVKLKNSCAISFDSHYKWITVNGYGATLPEIFIFDQMPPALYSYLQELDVVADVYSVTRDDSTYTVNLLDSTVIYDINTGMVHG